MMLRTNPLVMAEAKSIYDLYDTGNKYLVPSGDPEPTAYRSVTSDDDDAMRQLFRTSTLLLPEAKSIYSLEDTGNKVCAVKSVKCLL